jgi:hypothetical protein
VLRLELERVVRFIPIIAVVSEDTFHALNGHISGQPNPPAALQDVMTRNGWTIDAMCAGAILKAALDNGVERVS